MKSVKQLHQEIPFSLAKKELERLIEESLRVPKSYVYIDGFLLAVFSNHVQEFQELKKEMENLGYFFHYANKSLILSFNLEKFDPPESFTKLFESPKSNSLDFLLGIGVVKRIQEIINLFKETPNEYGEVDIYIDFDGAVVLKYPGFMEITFKSSSLLRVGFDVDRGGYSMNHRLVMLSEDEKNDIYNILHKEYDFKEIINKEFIETTEWT